MGNKSIADIFGDFRAEALRRKYAYEKACEENVALQGIRQELTEVALCKLQSAINGGEDAACDARLAELEQAEAQIKMDMPQRPFACARCKDTGIAGGEYCTCLLDRIYMEYYNAVDIRQLPIGFDTFDIALFDETERLPIGKTQRELMKIFVDVTQEYVHAFPATKRKNILLQGKAGLGKSYLLCSMAKQAKERGIDAMLIRANELFGLFFAHRMGEGVELSHLHGAKLLLIDDVGTEPITQNVSVEYFYELIAQRMAAGLHTVFATNVDDLQKRYDDRIASRLESKQDCIRLLFDGKDLRVN